MDTELKCNRLTCRKSLADKAVVVSLSLSENIILKPFYWLKRLPVRITLDGCVLTSLWRALIRVMYRLAYILQYVTFPETHQ